MLLPDNPVFTSTYFLSYWLAMIERQSFDSPTGNCCRHHSRQRDPEKRPVRISGHGRNYCGL